MTVRTLPHDLQEYVRRIQREQEDLKKHLNSWKEIEKPKSTVVAVPLDELPLRNEVKEEDEKLKKGPSHSRRSLLDEMMYQAQGSSAEVGCHPEERKITKMNRLQDRRYDQHKKSGATLVSEMIRLDIPEGTDDDPEMQEAIRLSLMETNLESHNVIQNPPYPSGDQKQRKGPPKNQRRDEPKKKQTLAQRPEDPQLSERNQVTKSSQKREAHSTPLPPPLAAAIEEENRCLICDERFDTLEHLYAFGHCDHACICGVCPARISSLCLLSPIFALISSPL
jgi:hypothetical protein